MVMKRCEVCGEMYNERSAIGTVVGGGAGAFGGAKAGAILGSVVPGLGTAAGVLVGGAIGWFVGAIKGGDDIDWAKNAAKRTAVGVICSHRPS
jgi:phage tail tape-measure protein